MKTKKITIMFCVVLLCVSTALYAKSDSTGGRPRIGILLDMKPLPDLLIKHLRLEPQQGIRISNIQEDSPADRAGLQPDDIIIGFEGEEVKSNKQLIDAVQKAGVGAEVSLEVIQLGERNVVKLKLDAMEKEFDLKYPHEPEIFQSWRPGKMFRFKLGDKNWEEIDIPFAKSLEVYEYHHSDDEEGYSVTIEGNPEDEDSLITVRIGNDSYQTAVGKIDDLPEKYRKVAKKVLENSLKHSQQRIKNKTGQFYNMLRPDGLSEYLNKIDELNKHLNEQTRFHLQSDLPEFSPDKQMFDKIEEQMRKMQERIEELEKRFEEIPGRSSGELDKDQI